MQKTVLLAVLATSVLAAPSAAPSCQEITNKGPQWAVTAPFHTVEDDTGRVEVQFQVNNLVDGKSSLCYGYLEAKNELMRGTCVAPNPDPAGYGFWTGYYAIQLETGDLSVTQRWECKDESGQTTAYNATATAMIPKYADKEGWNCASKARNYECDLKLPQPISMTATTINSR